MPFNPRESSEQDLRLGILPNLSQFLVQTLLVFFVGMTVGLERTVVPVLAKEEFAQQRHPLLCGELWIRESPAQPVWRPPLGILGTQAVVGPWLGGGGPYPPHSGG